jgi:peptidyl-tRNA hydrolase
MPSLYPPMADRRRALPDVGTGAEISAAFVRPVFHGQPTRTCLAIGPDDASIFEQVTEHLELL